MMPYIRITPLPSVNIQIVKETFRNRLHEKKPADHKRYQNLIMWPALNWIHSYHILVLLLPVFMHVNTRIEFFEGFFCLLAFVISLIPEHCSRLTIRFKKILTSSHLETSGSLLFKMNFKIFIPIRLFSNYCFLQLHNIKAQINISLLNVLGVYIHCMICYTQWLTIEKYDCLVFFKQLEN